MKIACVTSVRPVGCTFVDWSMHFLAGHSDYYRVLNRSTIPLVNTPLKSTNAHGHLKNHPAGFDQTADFINRFKTLDNVDFCSMYAYPMLFTRALDQLNLQNTDVSDSAVWNQINQYVMEDYKRLFNLCCDNDISTVYIDPDPTLNLYFVTPRIWSKFMFSDTPPKNLEEAKDEYYNKFFYKSIESWQAQGLTNVWDIREQLALATRPFDRVEDRVELDLTQPHLWVNGSELWSHGLVTIRTIMEYSKLSIVADRWQTWVPIYYEWQAIQQKHLSFAYQFDHIIESIVNGYFYNIGKLTFEQEVAIQHALIYKHNLNLKTWNLSEFPANTQDIHKLLETNIHPI